MKGPVLGVDLGGTNVRAGLALGDRLQTLASRAVRSRGTELEVFEDLCAVIESAGVEQAQGIGVGVPGLVDPRDGTIHDTINIPAWRQVPLKARLEQRYALPVRIDNDANCFALGERFFGQGRGCDNFVGLILGTGLGAGIISNGKLHSGVHCGAGEFGMIPYLDATLEHYASGQFFSMRGSDGAQASQAAARGEAWALQLFAQFGQHLGQTIKVILCALAPERIVLGGSVSRSRAFFEAALRESLTDFSYPAVTRQLQILTSELEYPGVLGAATLLWE